MKILVKILLATLVLLSLTGCLVKAPIDAAADVGSAAVHVATDVV